MEACANCGELIGKLETPYVYKDDVVCSSCHAKLTNRLTPPAIPTPPPFIHVPSMHQPVQVVVQAPPLGVVTIQKTAKKWKFFQVFGLIGFVVSLAIGIAMLQSGNEKAFIPTISSFICLIIYLRGKIGAWWNHA